MIDWTGRRPRGQIEWGIVDILTGQERATMESIADLCDTRATTVTRALKNLAVKGIVDVGQRRRRGKGNRLVPSWHLTDAYKSSVAPQQTDTEHLLKSPANADWLKESIEQCITQSEEAGLSQRVPFVEMPLPDPTPRMDCGTKPYPEPPKNFPCVMPNTEMPLPEPIPPINLGPPILPQSARRAAMRVLWECAGDLPSIETVERIIREEMT